MNLYKEELLDHYRYPRNSGVISNPDITTEIGNPACGDTVAFSVALDNNIIIAIKFTGQGCVISQAMASMLTEKVLTQDINSVLNYSKDTILDMIKISLGPTRLRCALLPLEALQQGIKEFKQFKF